MLRKLFFFIFLVALVSRFFHAAPAEARPFGGRVIQLPWQTVAPGPGQILVDFTVPANHDFAYEAPSTLWARIKDLPVLKPVRIQKKPAELDLSKLPFTIDYEATQGQTVAALDIRAHFCDKKTQICLTDIVRVKIPIIVKDGASNKMRLKIPLRSKVIA